MPGRIGRARYVVVHHPAADGIDNVRELVKPPFTDVPYDYVMDFETAAVWKGRPLWKDGAHVIPDKEWAMDVNNRTAIGVALEGNFHDDVPPIGPEPRHIEGLAILIANICLEHDIRPHNLYTASDVLGYDQGVLPHRKVFATACPGKHFMPHWDTLVGKVKWYWLRGG